MTDALNRSEMIELLEQLGSEGDAEVLAAAREVHERIEAAGMSWDDLLVTEQADDSEQSDDSEADAAEEPESPVETREDDAETLALIEKLLARSGISDDFREELTGYKEDIAEGEFEAADHRYVRALYKRLSA